MKQLFYLSIGFLFILACSGETEPPAPDLYLEDDSGKEYGIYYGVPFVETSFKMDDGNGGYTLETATFNVDTTHRIESDTIDIFVAWTITGIAGGSRNYKCYIVDCWYCWLRRRNSTPSCGCMGLGNRICELVHESTTAIKSPDLEGHEAPK